MFAARLSWVGVESRDILGRAGSLLQLATLIAGLALLEETWRDEPWAYRLHHVGQGLAARVRDFDLWDDSWGKKPAVP